MLLIFCSLTNVKGYDFCYDRKDADGNQLKRELTVYASYMCVKKEEIKQMTHTPQLCAAARFEELQVLFHFSQCHANNCLVSRQQWHG